MNHLTIISFSLLCCLASQAETRTWTDTQGRTLEAEIVNGDAESVTVLLNGNEVKIPLSKLSDDDQAYCKEWLEKKQKEAEAASGMVDGVPHFDGKPLIAGGKVNVFNYEYGPEALDEAKRDLKQGETGYRIGIAIPKDFDPTKPQRVFIANTAHNNAKQIEQGNTKMAEFFSKQCAQEGWVCFAFDSNVGRPKHDQDLVSAIAKMNEVWPNFKNWTFVVGGFSGGGKAAFWPAAYLLKNDYKVTGLFLANTNQDFSAEARELYRIKKSHYSDVSVFWGTGKWDPIANEKTGEEMKESLERNGMKEVRVEFHEGKHSLYHPQFIEALKWFAAKG